MASLNEVRIVGYLGSDPDLRYTQTQTAVALLSIATSRSYKDKAENVVEETEWHRVVVWGVQAENADRYLKKGSLVLVLGRLATRKWKDKDGADRWTTEIVAQSLQFLDRKPRDARPHPADAEDAPSPRAADDGPPDPADDEIPF